jgi:hypothetical protein
MHNSVRELVREIIKEELGRDLESTTDSMLDWRHLPGVDISITATDVKKNNSIPGFGRWVVNIKFEDGKEEIREFGSEDDANFFARKKAMHHYSSRVASNDLKSVKPFGLMGYPVEGR